jgi:hypothetical protein
MIKINTTIYSDEPILPNFVKIISLEEVRQLIPDTHLKNNPLFDNRFDECLMLTFFDKKSWDKYEDKISVKSYNDFYPINYGLLKQELKLLDQGDATIDKLLNKSELEKIIKHYHHLFKEAIKKDNMSYYKNFASFLLNDFFSLEIKLNFDEL